MVMTRTQGLWQPTAPSYGRAELERDWAAGQRPDFVFFWNPDLTPDGSLGPGCLSQWWPADFFADGRVYSSMEQFMMAAKARLFDDREILARILATADPGEIKALGRQVRNFDRALWDRRKYGVVVSGNVEKFAQNPPLRRFLLDTGTRVLAEASPFDRIWGIGLGKDDPDALLPSKWPGQNWVGFALMGVRAQLRSAPES